MNRPLLSRLLPNHVKSTLYSRYYRTRYVGWEDLFEVASLVLSHNSMFMHDLLPGDIISGHIAFNGFYELGLSRYILKLAKKGGLFVDVGANMGYFSLLWAGESSENTVIAFEAALRNISMLERNISENSLENRIILVPKAAGKTSGTILFDMGTDNQTGWGGISLNVSPMTIDVPIVRLDQELPDDAFIDLLKVDVEGADTWVLLGCEDLLKKKQIGVIIFEQNITRMEKLGIDAGEAQRFLQSLDYACSPFEGDDREWIAYPRKNLA